MTSTSITLSNISAAGITPSENHEGVYTIQDIHGVLRHITLGRFRPLKAEELA